MNVPGAAIGDRLGLRFNELALLLAIVATVSLTTVIDSNHSYYKQPLDSVRDIARNTAYLGIFALGATVVIIAGGIDLSAGSMIACSSVTCAVLMLWLAPEEMGSFNPVGGKVVAIAIGGALLTGFLIGTLHAWLITAVQLPPFIATLATLVGLRSFARALCEFATFKLTPSKSAQINVYDPIFKMLRENVWIPVTVFLVLAAFTWIVMRYTVLGRHLYALGGNEQAARLSGIRTENVKWIAYCFASMTAALAGVFYVANESVAAPVNQGRGQELNAIAAAVVGGCSLRGGIGTVSGTMLGALFLRVVIDAVAKIIKTGADVYEGLIVGIVVVLAVTFSQVRQVWGSGRQLFQGGMGILSIPILSGVAAIISWMTAGGATAAVVGLAAFGLLSGFKITEAVRAGRS